MEVPKIQWFRKKMYRGRFCLHHPRDGCGRTALTESQVWVCPWPGLASSTPFSSRALNSSKRGSTRWKIRNRLMVPPSRYVVILTRPLGILAASALNRSPMSLAAFALYLFASANFISRTASSSWHVIVFMDDSFLCTCQEG